MTAAPACPSDTDLRALLEDALDPTAVSTIEDHVNGCPACEKRLGRIVPNGAEFLLLQAHLDSDGSELPATLPGYEILGVLGRGGMGVVYKARHVKLDRVVALKMVTGSKERDALLMARFFAEAQAVASVNHPNVVEVYDFGEADGRAFLAMELLGGGSFAEQLRATPILAPKEAAAKIEQVARGVGAAHDAELVHRDLKPGNVMFAANGSPKVTDFGLAKRATSDLTASQAIVGTPNYMAPEQASGKGKFVGPTTDVWALGVMLFECLSGRRPFESSDAMSLLSKIVNENPPRLRSLVSGLPRELDVIVNKCLAKETGERYANASELADDLRRYQDGVPILAKPAGAIEKAYKWAKRNPGWAAMTTFLMLTMLTGTAVSLFYADQANKNAGRAEANATDANDQKILALAVAEREKQAMNREAEQRVRAEVAADKATEVLDVMVSDITGDSLATQKEITPEQKKLLTEVLPYYRSFLGQKADDEKSLARLAQAAIRVGVIEYRLGRMEKGVAAMLQARDRFESLVANFPTVPVYLQGLASSHSNLGVLLRDLGNNLEAVEHYRKGLDIDEKLAADFPAVSEYREGLANSHMALASLLDGLGKGAEVEAHFHKGLALLEKLAADFPAVPDYRRDLARSLTGLGLRLYRLRKLSEAEEHYHKGLAIDEKLAAEFPTVAEYQQELAKTHTSLGVLLTDLEKPQVAEEHYHKGLAIREKLAADFPAIPEYRMELAQSHNNLGILLKNLGKLPEAEGQFRKGLALQEKLAADFPAVPGYRRDLAGSHNNLGLLLGGRGKGAAAEEHSRKGLTIFEKLVVDFPAVPDYRQGLASSHNNLGDSLRSLGKLADAEEQYRKGLTLLEKLAVDFPAVPEYRVNLGSGYCAFGNLVHEGGKPADSLKWYGKAIATLLPAYEAEPRAVESKQSLLTSYWNRAIAYDGLQKFAEAVKDWDQAIELSPKEEQAEPRANRATSRLHAGMIAEAVVEVVELTKLPNWNAGQYYDFTCVYAVASGKIADKKAEYADRAMELLQKAVKAGYKDVAHLKQDKDLDPLREREDFKKLLAELQKT